MPYINSRWLGGLLTNWVTVQKSVKRLAELDDMSTDGRYELLTKKEVIKLERERKHLSTNLAGIKTMRACRTRSSSSTPTTKPSPSRKPASSASRSSPSSTPTAIRRSSTTSFPATTMRCAPSACSPPRWPTRRLKVSRWSPSAPSPRSLRRPRDADRIALRRSGRRGRCANSPCRSRPSPPRMPPLTLPTRMPTTSTSKPRSAAASRKPSSPLTSRRCVTEADHAEAHALPATAKLPELPSRAWRRSPPHHALAVRPH